MDKQIADIILSELRETRADVKELRSDFSQYQLSSAEEFAKLKQADWKLKTKFAIIVVSLGITGGKISQFFPFLR